MKSILSGQVLLHSLYFENSQVQFSKQLVETKNKKNPLLNFTGGNVQKTIWTLHFKRNFCILLLKEDWIYLHNANWTHETCKKKKIWTLACCTGNGRTSGGPWHFGVTFRTSRRIRTLKALNNTEDICWLIPDCQLHHINLIIPLRRQKLE